MCPGKSEAGRPAPAAKNLPFLSYAFITEWSPLSQHDHAARARSAPFSRTLFLASSIRYPCDRSSSDVHHRGSQREPAASVTEIKRNVQSPAEPRQHSRIQPQLEMFASLRLPTYISISGRLWDLSSLFPRCFEKEKKKSRSFLFPAQEQVSVWIFLASI